MKLLIPLVLCQYASAFVPAVTSPSFGRKLTVGRKASLSSLKALKDGEEVVLIGVAADSGCGKSTFMRRLTNIFGGESVGPLGGGFPESWETNTLVSDRTTVICLDDFHLNDRAGRKVTKLTALDARENNFDLMYEQLAQLKSGKAIQKPIYNHVNGTLDEDEKIEPTPIIIFEGLHPFYDDRVNDLMDFRIYVDITPETKFNWKVQRDCEERGWTVDQVKDQIKAREPDFNSYIDPQKEKADVVIQVLPTELAKDDKKHLKVEMIQVKGIDNFTPSYILDPQAEVDITLGGIDLGDGPGLKVYQKQQKWAGKDAVTIGMDGKYAKISEMDKLEKMIADSAAKSAGEATQKMMEYEGQPGSNDGTGFLQTIVSLKVREIYEAITKTKVAA